ncbi:MAG: hypothetical protein ACFB02_07980 [Mastigocoleus sp.]
MKNILKSTLYISRGITFSTLIATTIFAPLGVKALESINDSSQTEYKVKINSESQLKTAQTDSLQTKSPKLIAQALRVNLNGRWRGNDGGIYYLRQIGNELWWYGESRDRGNSWSNVFHGYIGRTQVAGKWADVPKGRIIQSGDMRVQIVSSNRLIAVRKTGGFGGSVWTRIR